jgi:hypothetical protein
VHSKKPEILLRNYILRETFSGVTVLCSALDYFQEDLKALLFESPMRKSDPTFLFVKRPEFQKPQAPQILSSYQDHQTR